MDTIIDGVRLAYDVAGSGEGLILLHDFLLDRTIWDAQFDALAQHCRVIRIDLRGSGESACGEGPALMETLAGDVFGLLEALDVPRVVLVGHGMGGYVALAFFRMYAERVAGLALVASHVCAERAEQFADHAAIAVAIEAGGIEAASDLYALADVGVSVPGRAEIATRTRAIVARQSTAGAMAQLNGMKQRIGSEDLLEDIAVPTTLIVGKNRAWQGSADVEAIAAAIADCTVERLAGVGQLPMLEAPAATTAALERLVARCTLTAQAEPQNVGAGRV